MSATQILQIAEWTIADRGKEQALSESANTSTLPANASKTLTDKSRCFRSILSRRVPRMHCFD